MNIPVLNAQGEIVEWTATPPVVREGKLVHEHASRLLKGEIATGEIILTKPEDLRRAGAPEGWSEPWRCLAICPAMSASQFGASRSSEMLSTFPGGGGGSSRPLASD
jgi:hypothetical protein